jgi:hypothetical protein
MALFSSISAPFLSANEIFIYLSFSIIGLPAFMRQPSIYMFLKINILSALMIFFYEAKQAQPSK